MSIPALPPEPLEFEDLPKKTTPLSAGFLNLWRDQMYALAQAGQAYAFSAQESATEASQPTDAMLQAVLENEGSGARLLLDSAFVKRGEVQVDVHDYGAVGDNVTDDTAAINAACDAAAAIGTHAVVFMRAKTYRTTGTVKVRTGMEASQARINYTGTGVALQAGPDSGVIIQRVKMNLPLVVKLGRPKPGWDGTSVGVLAQNLGTCEIRVPYVRDFETGLLCFGDERAFSYNTIFLGELWDNHTNFDADSVGAGFSNQNLVLGGRIIQSLSAGETDEDPTAYMIRLGRPGAAKRPNNWTFVNTCLEGDNPAYYRLVCEGPYNQFINCRWEHYNSEQSRVFWGVNAHSNTIYEGYEAWRLEPTHTPGSYSNTIVTNRGYLIEASAGSQTIPHNTVTEVTGWTSVTRGASFNGSGWWTPQPGRWRISVSIGFSGNATGHRMARIVKGSTVIGYSQVAPAGTDGVVMTLTACERFDGTEPFFIDVRQTSGGNLGRPSTPGYAILRAERVGVEGPPPA